MGNTTLSTVQPHNIGAVGGFLGRRFDANRKARLKDCMLYEHFIRLHERKQYDDWFWLGEQVGKWLDAGAHTGLIARDQDLLHTVHEVLERLARSQETDGYLGITSRAHRNPVRGMELYEMYYVLHGLLVCAELLGSDTALKTARRLGDYIIRTWGPEPGQFPLAGRFPGNGHNGGEGTLILEPIVLLGQQTGESRYVEWGERVLSHWDEWLDTYQESAHTCGYTAMKPFAAGEKDVYELRWKIHAHTFHMTLLGLAALYNATGKEEYRRVALGCIDRLAAGWVLLTGGMSSHEHYVPRRFYHPRSDVEVCPQHTWVLLLQQALQWTGEARYAAEIERTLFNHLLAAQVADGSNWSYFTPLNGRAEDPRGPNCCNASGHRIAGRMPIYLYGLRGGEPAVLLYTASQATLSQSGAPEVGLRQETDFPSDGEVTIHVDLERPARFRLHLRIPPYAEGATMRMQNDSPHAVQAGDFLVIDREWSPGDTVKLALPCHVTCQANADAIAFVRGPLVYAYFQDAQPDPVLYHGRHHGVYPEDVVLHADPSQLEAGVWEEAAPDGLLGPALRVPGHIRAQAPLFASRQANLDLTGQAEQSLLLLPFANQGAIRGEYRVFIGYESPGRRVSA